MYTIKDLYKIGNGPSSSHTMAPKRALNEFIKRYPDIDFVKVILYGSLALTGKGHLTDKVILDSYKDIKKEVVFDIKTEQNHPNTMEILGFKDSKKLAYMKVLSVGGGDIKILGDEEKEDRDIYPLNKFNDIKNYLLRNNLRLYEYVDMYEDSDIDEYLEKVLDTMLMSVERGLSESGTLPGDLKVYRKAKEIYEGNNETNIYEEERRKLVSYAYAVSEENASGGVIVTAPTCGASGVLPAVLKYNLDKNKYSKKDFINALKTAGLLGNLVKTNASISGAVAGCQAEVGVACLMAAAFQSELEGASISRIGQAAEIALEHHLGLTCDPIKGYVQIPCIERNAVAALRAIDASKLSSYLRMDENKIDLDLVIDTMLDTGVNLDEAYKETSIGGLAKKYKK